MSQETINFCPEEGVDNKALKALEAKMTVESTRNHNVGNSNYAEMPKGYQPWDLQSIKK